MVAIAEGRAPIALRSVLIGNGFTDVTTMLPSYYDMQCTDVSVSPILSVASCVAMKAAVRSILCALLYVPSHGVSTLAAALHKSAQRRVHRSI